VSAQDDDKIKKMKISFFTDQLDLSRKEAQEFWPVYNHHNDKYDSLKENKWRGIVRRLKKVDKLNEEEATDLLVDYREYKRLRYEYREDFIKDLKSVITDKKIMQLKHAEYEFDKKLLDQYRSSDKKS
jgi:hypothetical protein